MKELARRIAELEGQAGGGDDGRLLHLFSHMSEPGAAAELEQRIAAGAGSPGMLNVADVLLQGQRQVEAADAAGEGTTEGGYVQ
jgi:hypothetical protein